MADARGVSNVRSGGQPPRRSRSPFTARRDADRARAAKRRAEPVVDPDKLAWIPGTPKPTGAFARLSSGHRTLWIGNIGDVHEEALCAHFRERVNQSAQVEVRCLRGMPLKHAGDVPIWAEGAKAKGARYAVLTFEWEGRTDEAPPGVQEFEDRTLQIEHDMIYIREVRMLANDAEAKLERMREEKLPETEWEKSEGQAPVVRSRMGWFGSASD